MERNHKKERATQFTDGKGAQPRWRAAIHMPHTTCWTYASYHMHMHECCTSAIYPLILAHSHLGSLEAARRPLFQSPEAPVDQSGSFKSSREVVNTRPTSHYRSIPSHTFHTPGLGASFPPLSRRESSRVFERVSGKRSSTRGARAQEGGGSIAITPRELCAAIGMIFELRLGNAFVCHFVPPPTR